LNRIQNYACNIISGNVSQHANVRGIFESTLNIDQAVDLTINTE
jgi:hypothetical protein